ncbi:PR-1-like protein [Piedraia hortae CBS 480.64]|uniref:PR-1-like protein n=1 Tax=Piedraia hortae CBS 480.64 TaxID=1314780 RepID=A0A6A7BTQ2_9PEZI|nr:PR-1-like protein [Piedraia hortae CBS 480.64]
MRSGFAAAAFMTGVLAVPQLPGLGSGLPKLPGLGGGLPGLGGGLPGLGSGLPKLPGLGGGLPGLGGSPTGASPSGMPGGLFPGGGMGMPGQAPPPRPSGPPPAPGTYEAKVLEAHNVHRANHSAPDICWDAGLAATAQKIADTCKYEHNTQMDGGGYGQNIAAGYTPEQIKAVITNGFYNSEVNAFEGQYGQDSPSNFEAWGHFTQVVWKSSTLVGCATKDCSSQGLANAGGTPPYFTVCNYKNQGNMMGTFKANVGVSLHKPTVTEAQPGADLSNSDSGKTTPQDGSSGSSPSGYGSPSGSGSPSSGGSPSGYGSPSGGAPSSGEGSSPAGGSPSGGEGSSPAGYGSPSGGSPAGYMA